MKFYIVDCFAEEKYQGNELLVVIADRFISDREQQQIAVGRNIRSRNGIEKIHHGKQSDLYAESHQIADDVLQRHDESREIYLSKNARIAHKRVGGLVETIGKILPHADTTQIEQRLWNAIGGDASDTTKNHHIKDDRHRGLDDPPKWPENGLLVTGNNVAFDEQNQQVTVIPYFLKIHLEKFVSRCDDRRIILFHG